MKGLGWLLACAGVVYLVFAFNMDVSVHTPYSYIPGVGGVGGNDVANLDLMARRQNHIIIAALMTLVGVLLGIFGPEPAPVNNGSASGPVPDMPPFSGERDLGDDPYRLWLATTYKIERNEVFDRFVVGNQTFASLDAALEFAHREEEAHQQSLRDREAERQAHLEQLRIQQAERAEQAERDWDEFKPKLIAGGVISVLAVIAMFLFIRESPEEKKARLAAEARDRIALIERTEKEFKVDLPDDVADLHVGPPDAGSLIFCGVDDAIAEAAADAAADATAYAGDRTLASFTTKTTPKDIQKLFAKSLGKGARHYESLEDNFDWDWKKGGRGYTLNLAANNGDPNLIVNLCMEKR